jgi:hypothetical protein
VTQPCLVSKWSPVPNITTSATVRGASESAMRDAATRRARSPRRRSAPRTTQAQAARRSNAPCTANQLAALSASLILLFAYAGVAISLTGKHSIQLVVPESSSPVSRSISLPPQSRLVTPTLTPTLGVT